MIQLVLALALLLGSASGAAAQQKVSPVQVIDCGADRVKAITATGAVTCGPVGSGGGASTSTPNTWTATQTFGPVIGAVSTQSGTTYTLAATDCGTTLRFTSATAVTLTLPASLSAGCSVGIVQAGAGQVSFTAGSGASLVNRQSFTKTAGQWALMGLTIDTNAGGSAAHYVLTGDGAS